MIKSSTIVELNKILNELNALIEGEDISYKPTPYSKVYVKTKKGYAPAVLISHRDGVYTVNYGGKMYNVRNVLIPPTLEHIKKVAQILAYAIGNQFGIKYEVVHNLNDGTYTLKINGEDVENVKDIPDEYAVYSSIIYAVYKILTGVEND